MIRSARRLTHGCHSLGPNELLLAAQLPTEPAALLRGRLTISLNSLSTVGYCLSYT
jgi:hypothetical protein